MAQTFTTCSDQITFKAEKAQVSEKFDAIGGRVVGVILSLYGLAVVFEVLRSYVLVG